MTLKSLFFLVLTLVPTIYSSPSDTIAVVECEGVVCPEGAYLDYTCQCRCDTRCPDNYQLDERNCICFCDEQRCYEGITFDYDKCECPPSKCSSINLNCPRGTVFDHSVCDCNCYENIYCPNDNFQVDPRTCDCICSNVTCPSGFKLDQKACECVENLMTRPSEVIECEGVVCPEGAHLDYTCQCRCDTRCRHNLRLDERDCGCYCDVTSCEEGISFSFQKCECQPSRCPSINLNCPRGTVFDHSICDCNCYQNINCSNDNFQVDPRTCDCICSIVTCPSGFTLDQKVCECVEDLMTRPSEVIECEGVVCPEGAYLDYTCQCRCEKHCPDNFEIDEKACQCLCREQNCHDYYIFDFKSCNCICDEQAHCYDGSPFDYENCRCVSPDESTAESTTTSPSVNSTISSTTTTKSSTNTTSLPSCPPNYIYDEESCKCICDPTYEEDCLYSFTWDSLKCGCVCVHDEICKSGYEFNKTRCECSCIEKKCRPNFIFDSETCDCICGLTKETAKCEKGYVFDPTSCECIKDPNGPSGC